MSELSRIAKVLRKNTTYPGITVSKLAKLAGVMKNTVYKRIADLRQETGRIVYSNYRKIDGTRTLFYRIADTKTNSTQLARIAKVLRNHTSGHGISAAMLAKLAGVSRETVYKRIAELRQETGRVVYSNYRMVNGKRKLFYRIADTKTNSTQLARIAKVLRKNNSGHGISVAMLAKLAGVSKETVHKRIAELRQETGRVIYSNYRMVNGKRKLFYRIAA